jgi:hypothetical protein
MNLWRYVYTKSLDKADDVRTECRPGLTKEEAKQCFDDKVMELMALVLDNEFLECTVNLHRMRAVITIEGERHVVAAMENTKENAS